MLKVCTPENYSSVLKEIRQEKNLTLERAGVKIGKAFQTVQSYECGRVVPSVKDYIELLNKLGYQVVIIKNA